MNRERRKKGTSDGVATGPGVDMSLGRVDETTNIYYIEKILDWWRSKANKVLFRVKWELWDNPNDNTWEPLVNLLEDCPALLAEYVQTTTKEPKMRLLKAYKEALQLKGIQPPDELFAVSHGTARPSSQRQKKKRNRRKKKTKALPLAGHDSDSNHHPETATAAEDCGPQKAGRSRKRKSDVAVAVRPENIPGARVVPHGQPMTYDQLKVLSFLKLRGVTHRCLTESTFMNGGVPYRIGSTVDLPEVGTIGYLVKYGEGQADSLVFHEVAKRFFPNSLNAYLLRGYNE